MIEILLTTLGAYLLIGFAFAVPFVLIGTQRIDPAAERGSWGFRLLILPGSVALWPLLLKRWVTRRPPVEYSLHRRAADSVDSSDKGDG